MEIVRVVRELELNISSTNQTKVTICRAAETQQTFSGVAHLKSWAAETGELSQDDLLISASVDEGGQFYNLGN